MVFVGDASFCTNLTIQWASQNPCSMYGKCIDRSWALSGIHNGLGVAGIGGMVGNEHTVFLTRHPQSNGRTRHGRKGGSWRCMEMLYGGMTSTLRSTDCSMHMLIWSSSIKHACTNGAFGSPPCSSMESTGVDDAERCSCKRCVSGIGVLQSKDSSIQARKRNTMTSGSFGAVRELFWNLYRWVVIVMGLRSM